jgi:glutathione-independent formaldehyde dehydrogenase
VSGAQVQSTVDAGHSLHDKVRIAKACNVTIISLDDAPKGYKDFDKGAAKKFVIDPHRSLAAA